MPYGTWVTCEESVAGPDLDADFVGQGPNLLQKHGYIYEVSAASGPNENALTVPIRAAGRFTHEGAAMDPATGIQGVGRSLSCGLDAAAPGDSSGHRIGARPWQIFPLLTITYPTYPRLSHGSCTAGSRLAVPHPDDMWVRCVLT